MNRHPDCEDCCQLREHKGYISCSLTGECAYAEQQQQDEAQLQNQVNDEERV